MTGVLRTARVARTASRRRHRRKLRSTERTANVRWSKSRWPNPPTGRSRRRCSPMPRRPRSTCRARSTRSCASRPAFPTTRFTAPILGTEREGNGVVIRDNGLIVTIGYLITEAEAIWITTQRRPRGARDIRSPTTSRRASGSCCRCSRWAARCRSGRLPTCAVDDDVYRDRPRRTCARAQGRRCSRAASSRATGSTCSTYALFTTPAASGVERRGAGRRRTARLVGIGSLFVQEAEDDECARATCSCRSTC